MSFFLFIKKITNECILVMKKYSTFCFCLLLSFTVFANKKIDISGKWAIGIDSLKVGINEKWQNKEFRDSILLPGCMHMQGFGFEVTPRTKWYSGNLSALWQNNTIYEKFRKQGNIKIYDFLQPKKQYVGVAWYKRNFELANHSKKNTITLNLERVHWESTLFINGIKVGSNLGIGTVQEYDITDFVRKGKNEIALRIDNSAVINIGRINHSLSEQTMAAWNGVLGNMSIELKEKIWIKNIRIFPDIKNRQARVELTTGNKLTKGESVFILLQATCYNTPNGYAENKMAKTFTINPESDSVFNIIYPISDKMQLWDEFNPVLYRLNVQLRTGKILDEVSEVFGFREIKTVGRNFVLNGKAISIRGNLECGVFPVDGIPEMNVEWWKKIFKIYKESGHNMARFHSWCPPKAAFIAADEVGIYLQPEASEWVAITTKRQESFIVGETDRMTRQYGNHPSWLFIAMGNELKCDTAIMERFIANQKKDSRRIVTGKVNGRPLLESFDFYASHSIDGKRFRHHMGWPPKPETNLLFHMKPNTDYDYSEAVALYPKPFIAHEVGQYCVFPDYERELPKFTGSMRATVLDIQKDQLSERGMSGQAAIFTEATGKWQIELLKSEYEANFRTKDLAGFHSLSLQDFPGQGHAPVGIFDMFWEAKKYVHLDKFRQFCDKTVILARIPSLILQQKDTFNAFVELYNFSEKPIIGKTVNYRIADSENNTVEQGTFGKQDFENGKSNLPIGKLSLELKGLKAPLKYTLHVNIQNTDIENSWSFWVYPTEILFENGNVKVVEQFDAKTIQYLNEGQNVLWLTDQTKLKGQLPTCFGSFYWTTFGMNQGETMCNSILCDPKHPLYQFFPTEIHSNWQWWDILKYSIPMILDEYKAINAFPKTYTPVLQAIDSWRINRKLALLAECRFGKGKLMISSIDFKTKTNDRVASRQLYSSLLKYMNSIDFNPEYELNKETILSIYGKQENNLFKLGATIKTSNVDAKQMDKFLLDGDMKTVWSAKENGEKHNYITLKVETGVQIKGFSMKTPSASNEADYNFFISKDGIKWESVKAKITRISDVEQHIIFEKPILLKNMKIEFNKLPISIFELDILFTDTLPVEG